MNSFKKLGELLVEGELITNLQLSIALAAQQTSSKRLGQIVVERGFATEDQINDCLARQYHYPVFEVDGFKPDPNALKELSADLALSHSVLPIFSGDHFECVISDPIDIITTDLVARLVGKPLKLRLCAAQKLRELIRTSYNLDRRAPVSIEFDEFPLPDRFVQLACKRRFDATILVDAMDKELDREVTLSLVPAGSEEEAAQYRRIRAAARVSSPFVASVHDWFEWEGKRWTVYDRLVGETLEQILATRGARTARQAADMVAKIAEGVDAMTQSSGNCGFVCPANIFLSEDRIQIVPFVPAPVGYSSPEGSSQSSDIFALGTLLWESLRGANPHDVGDKAQLWGHPAEDLDLLPSMSEILSHCMARLPEQRYASPILIANALRGYNWSPLVMTSNALSQRSQDREELLEALIVHENTPKKSFWQRLFSKEAA